MYAAPPQRLGPPQPSSRPHVGLAPQGLTGHPRAIKLCSWGWGGQGGSQSLSQGVLSPSLLADPGLEPAAMETRLCQLGTCILERVDRFRDYGHHFPGCLVPGTPDPALPPVPTGGKGRPWREREVRGAGIGSRTQQTRAGGQRRAEGLPHKPQRRARASCGVCPGGHQPSSWGREQLGAWEQRPTLGAFPRASKSSERAACREPLTRQLPPRRLEPWCGRVEGCEGSSHSSHRPVPSPVGPLDGSPASKVWREPSGLAGGAHVRQAPGCLASDAAVHGGICC